MNSEKNKGFKISASFAFERREASEQPISSAKEALAIAKEAPLQNLDKFDDDGENHDSLHPPIVVSYPNDDVYEKVTQFERQKKTLTVQQRKLIEMLKMKAAESKGTVTVRRHRKFYLYNFSGPFSYRIS